MNHVSVQSSWEVAQISYDMCHVSAQSSWEVVQSSYGVYYHYQFVYSPINNLKFKFLQQSYKMYIKYNIIDKIK